MMRWFLPVAQLPAEQLQWPKDPPEKGWLWEMEEAGGGAGQKKKVYNIDEYKKKGDA